MNNLVFEGYEAPLVKVINVEIEKGFAQSKGTVSGWGDGGGYEGSFFD